MPTDITGDFSRYPKLNELLTRIYGEEIYLKSTTPEPLNPRFEAEGCDPRQEWYFLDTDCYTAEQHAQFVQALQDERGRTRKQAEATLKAGVPLPTLHVTVHGSGWFELDVDEGELAFIRKAVESNRRWLGLPPQEYNEEK